MTVALDVGVDLDGVCVEWLDGMRRYLGLTIEEAPDPWRWDVWSCWGMRREEFQAYADEAYEQHLFYKLKPYPGAIEALKEITELGHRLHIITARPAGIPQRDTVAWLEDFEVPYASLTFTAAKESVAVDVMVDDYPTNALACLKAGARSFLMDRPWNQPLGGDDDLPRVLNMTDYVAAVQHVAAQRCAAEEAAPPRQERPFEPEPTEWRETSATGGQKGQKPEQYSLLPVEALEYISRVYAFGAEKYSRSNWRAGYPKHLSYDAANRHMVRYWGGEDLDPESGLPHLAHAAFHLMTLLTFDAHPAKYDEFDDREKVW